VTAAALLLAAGLGRRFPGPEHKLLVSFRGRPLASWAMDAAGSAGLDELVVVIGEGAEADELRAIVPEGARVVVNARAAAGQATSLAAGIEAVDGGGHDAVVVGLADQPLVPSEAWRLVATVAPEAPVVVASFGDARRPPVRLARSVWPLLPTTGDEGARALLRSRPDLVTEVPCPGDPADIDTPEDLARWS